MDLHTPKQFANIEASVSLLPEVLECLLLNKLTRIAGVTGVHSRFVLRQVLAKTALAVSTGAA